MILRFISCLFAVLWVSSPAMANITKSDIQEFNDGYQSVYKTCNLEEIRNYIDTYFSDDYVTYFKDNNGNVQNMTKQDIINAMQDTISYVEKNNLETATCNTQVQITDIQIQDDIAIVQMVQNENIVLEAPNGQTVPVSTNTVCNHAMSMASNRVQVLQSQCQSPNN